MTDIKYLRLWDVYQKLLTENQQEITDLYFNCDLSLGEIAEQRNVSRQSVADAINKSKKQLEEYENKLHFAKVIDDYSLQVSITLTRVNVMLEEFKEKNAEHINEISSIQNALVVGELFKEEE